MQRARAARGSRYALRAAALLLLAGALLLGAFHGCSSKERLRVVLRLAPPPAADRPDPAERPAGADVAPLVWEFDSAADLAVGDSAARGKGWIPGDGIRYARIEDGALVFEATSNDPKLILPRHVSFLEYDRMEVTMRTSAGQFGGVYWATRKRAFDQDKVRAFPLRHGPGFETYRVRLGVATQGYAGATALRFDPMDAPGEVAIDRIRLLPAKDDVIDRAVLWADKSALDREFRDAELFRGTLDRTVRLDLPPRASVRWSFGTLAGSREIAFSLERIAEDGRGIRLFQKTPEPGRWAHKTIDVHGSDGETELTLRVRAEPSSPEAAGVCGGLEVLAPDDSGMPNVLLVVVDTLRADALSCYGHPAESTPCLDRLASEGVRFERAVAQCSWTIPSVASYLTGRYPSELDVEWGKNFRIPKSVPTLARRLADSGYATRCIFGNGIVDERWGFDEGFDRFLLGRDLELTADRITDRAIDWLRHMRDERFFLYLHYIDPHDAYAPPPESLATNPFVRSPDEVVSTQRIDDLFLGKSPLEGEEELERIRRMYAAEVYFTDRNLGRLFQALASLGLDGETLVVVTADHGEEFFEHGGWRHGLTLYDEVLRVPLILRFPDRRYAGSVVPERIELLDLLPTIYPSSRGCPLPSRGRPSPRPTRTDRGASPSTTAPGSFSSSTGRRSTPTRTTRSTARSSSASSGRPSSTSPRIPAKPRTSPRTRSRSSAGCARSSTSGFASSRGDRSRWSPRSTRGRGSGCGRSATSPTEGGGRRTPPSPPRRWRSPAC